MNLPYAWQKCTEAVSCLAESSETMQQRLIDCGLALLVLTVEDFPENLKADFEKIEKEFNHADGHLEASVRAMSDEKAEELAKKIVSMSHTIILKYGATDEGRRLASLL